MPYRPSRSSSAKSKPTALELALRQRSPDRRYHGTFEGGGLLPSRIWKICAALGVALIGLLLIGHASAHGINL
jgi:hypothetical protein